MVQCVWPGDPDLHRNKGTLQCCEPDSYILQVAVLELNDTVKILQGEKVKDKKARNSRIPTDCKYVLIKMQFIPLCSDLPF